MGLSFGYVWTDIDWQFEDEPPPGVQDESALTKYSASIIIERRLGQRGSLQFAAGSVLGGLLVVRGTEHDIGPGWIYSAGYSHQLLRGRSSPIFLVGSVSLGASLALTEERHVPAPVEQLLAFDGRLGLTVGKTLEGWLSPYASLRVFGLPIYWRFQDRSVVGTDAHKYAVAAGVTARPADWLDFHFDAAMVGETGITVGAGSSF